MRSFLPFLALPVLAACELITGPRLPDGAVRFDPPPVYAEWWRMTEQCSALGGDFRRVAFYVVNDRAISSDEGEEVQGVYLYGDRIVVSRNSQYNGQIVRHEMLHALLKGKGHPRPDFVGRCGGVVSCSIKCIEEGRPKTPPANAQRVQPAFIKVSVDVWPPAPSASVLEGYVRVTVTARNPESRPVVVNLPSYFQATPLGFGARVSSGSWSMVRELPIYAVENTWFAGGETKLYVFEFWATGNAPAQLRLAPGTYAFSGAFGDRWGTAVPLTIQ